MATKIKGIKKSEVVAEPTTKKRGRKPIPTAKVTDTDLETVRKEMQRLREMAKKIKADPVKRAALAKLSKEDKEARAKRKAAREKIAGKLESFKTKRKALKEETSALRKQANDKTAERKALIAEENELRAKYGLPPVAVRKKDEDAGEDKPKVKKAKPEEEEEDDADEEEVDVTDADDGDELEEDEDEEDEDEE